MTFMAGRKKTLRLAFAEFPEEVLRQWMQVGDRFKKDVGAIRRIIADTPLQLKLSICREFVKDIGSGSQQAPKPPWLVTDGSFMLTYKKSHLGTILAKPSRQ